MNTIKILTAIVLLQGHLFAATWLTDFSAAQTKAKTENKLILLDFTGSDWCGWCIKLKNEVFSQADFEAFANESLVLVEVDFPRGKAQPVNVKTANQALATKFAITGYPTVVLLDSDGNKVGVTGYRPGGAKAYVAELQKLAGSKLAKPSAPANVAAGQQPDPVKIPVPLFSGAPTAPPPVYNDLQLKGVTGPKGRRFAMINNKTFGEGEAGVVKLGTAQVKVQCVEIGEDSVVILVDGATKRTLRLKGHL
jgi:protein disulfide-isomerase